MMPAYALGEYEVVTDYRPCPHHASHPESTFAECTCMSCVTLVKRDTDRGAEAKAARERQREENLP